MGTELARTDTAAVMERVLMVGDLSKLSAAERVSYYLQVCDSLGLNPATRPFDYITLQGKMQLYARRDAADQLRRRDKISITITAREKVDDVYVVTARATAPDERTDEAIGAVPLAGLRGEALANAFMKAETKAKRRVTLSICGLGFTDESEVDSIPGAQRVQVSDDGEIIDVPSKPATQSTPQPTAPAAQPTLRPAAPQPSRNPDELVVNFGKHSGKTVSAILAEDPGYAKWLADKAQDAAVKLAAQTLLQTAEQPKTVAQPTVPAETLANYKQTLVNEAQLKRLYAIASEHKVPAAIIKEHLRDKYGLDSSKQLNREQYDEVCAWLEAQGKADVDDIDIGDGIPDNWAAGLEPPPEETFGDQCGQFAFGGEPA